MDDLSTLPTGAVFRRDGKPMTTSRQVADLFGKRHDNVTRDIDRLIKTDPSCALNFEETSELTAMPRGGFRKSRVYSINQRGAALLIMGFTGAEALRWKQKFLDAFDHLAERENDNHKAFLRSMRKSQPPRGRATLRIAH